MWTSSSGVAIGWCGSPIPEVQRQVGSPREPWKVGPPAGGAAMRLYLTEPAVRFYVEPIYSLALALALR